MYELRVTDHIMIAHSLADPFFGPAQHLHGATYIVHAKLQTPKLNKQMVVMDIGQLSELLKRVLADLNYKNLDDVEALRNKLTTTEFLASYIHELLSTEIHPYFEGQLQITLDESHIASASYSGPVNSPLL